MGRTPQEDVRIEHRRKQVSELYLKNWMQADIASELGVSQPTISSDLKAIRQEWSKSRIRNSGEALAETLNRLKVVAREAWGGWQRSQKPVETNRIIQKNGERKLEKTIREQTGNPQFLQILERTIEKYWKLLGLDSAAITAFKHPDEEALREKITLELWDFFVNMTDPNIPEPIDYIERRINSVSDATDELEDSIES